MGRKSNLQKRLEAMEQPPPQPRPDIEEVRTIEGKATDDALAYEMFVPEGGDLYWDWSRKVWVVFTKKKPKKTRKKRS